MYVYYKLDMVMHVFLIHFRGAKGLILFTLGHPYKTTIQYPTPVTWLWESRDTIIMKGICFEVTMWRAYYVKEGWC